MKKILVVTLIVAFMMALCAVTFAGTGNPSDLANWEKGASDSSLDDANDSILNLGASVNKVIRTIAQILISVIVTFIGIRFTVSKDAQAKKDIKGQILNLVLGSVGVFFGISILIKFLTFVGQSFL